MNARLAVSAGFASHSPVLSVLALGLLAFAGPAQAAEQPEAPGDFRNGQDNHFGSIAMVPYLSAGKASVPIEASIVLRDLETLGQAADVLFAFNVKGDAVRATIESLRTADGEGLVPLRTGTVDDGRQPQAHFAPADLLAAAKDGRLDLVLAGRVEAKAASQSHVGAMVIAFDEGWAALASGDGSAQLYGFTMVSAVGLGGGVMPFQGQGNTWAVLPLALPAFVVALAGAMAVSVLARTPPTQAPAAPAGHVGTLVPSPIPTFGHPAKGAAQAGPPAATPAIPAPSAAPATAIPVFGGPEPLPQALRQGPVLPPHPLDRSPLLGGKPPPAATPPAAAEAEGVLPAKPAAAEGAVHGRPARPAGGAVLTATRRPKAKTAGKATSAATPPTRRPAPRKRVAPNASRSR